MTNQPASEKRESAGGTLPPNPGSDAAVELGCTCPVLDNGRGAGYMGREGVFWIHGGCPLHGKIGAEYD